MLKLGTFAGPSKHSFLCIGSPTVKWKNWKVNPTKFCEHKNIRGYKIACGKNTSNIIQLLLTVEYLPLFSPCFLKIDCREGTLGHVGCVCAVGTTGALGPACLLFSTPSEWITVNSAGRRKDMWSVSLKVIPVTCSAEVCSWSQKLETILSKDSISQHVPWESPQA